ncbi:MAG: sulfotransferase family protein [Rubrobacter sp.]
MNPVVFIVGCQRSGTTLLQRMVDASPHIAVVHESRWIDTWYRKRIGLTPDGNVTPDFIPLLLEHPRFPELKASREDLEGLLPNGQPIPYRSFVSGVFDLHGRALGKPRVGDKTPRYVRSVPTLHELWPEAKFVHLIRDGRDVCLSALEWKSGGELSRRFETWKTDPVATAGVWWDWLVRLGREAGEDLGPALYHEIRYESLVSDPVEECAKLCEFLDIPYDSAMLRFHEGREREAPGLSAKGAWKRVTTGLRDWRTELSGESVEVFEAAAGESLEELGYGRAVPEPGAMAVETVSRVRESFFQEVRAEGERLPERWSR